MNAKTVARRLFASTLTVGLSLAAGMAGGCGPKSNGKLRVGFAQSGMESGWRAANTADIKAAAGPADVDLHFADSPTQAKSEQINALNAFLQQRLDVVAFSPKEETGWDTILRDLKNANIPVIVSDRNVKVSDPSLQPIFIGSDLYEEGRRAGDWLAKKTGGKARIVILEGNPGGSATIDRTNGFNDAIKDKPDMKVVVTRSGYFDQGQGKDVMKSILTTPEGGGLTALYAENDDMGLGAIQALQAAGKVPGKDVIIVAVDGTKNGLAAVADGTLNCTIECNPLLGPAIMETAKKLKAGQPVERRIISKENLIDDPAVAKKMHDERVATNSAW